MGASDDLYGLPLERFTAERDALAKQLRASGERDQADAVKKLPKPTRAAWALNTAVREKPEAAEALAESVRLLEEAQKELLAGGDASALRQATERARAAIDELVAAAPAAKDKVRETLYAALVEPEVLAEVISGRVPRERLAGGFGGLAGLAAAAGATRKRKAKAPPKKRAVPPAKLRAAKEAEAAAEGDVDAARRALDQAEAQAERRRSELRTAEKRLDDARRRRERAEAT
jgi:hypothetical protein